MAGSKFPPSTSSPSPEITKLSPISDKPTKNPAELVTRRRSLAKSEFSKPKSRLVEPPYPTEGMLLEEKTQLTKSNKSNRNSPHADSPNRATNTTPRNNLKSAPITPRTPLIGATGEDEDDDEEVYKTADLKMSQKSGPPLMEMAENFGKSTGTGQLSFRNLKQEKKGAKEEVIDIDKLKKMKQGRVSAWTMKGLINVIRNSRLSTISNTLEDIDEEDGEQKDEEITSEWAAKAAAYRIFRNLAKPGNKYIDGEDLLRFMKKEEVDNVLQLFEGAVETGTFRRKTLKNWLVNVYLERKSLAHSLNDTKTAVEELNKIVSVILLIVIIIVWFLMMGLLTTQVLVFVSSQLLVVVFIFGNTAKTVFEAMIFVFVMHPLDVGDRCVIDGVQMVVEEMNILTTVFLRYDNEKIFYPNSVLATKPISNFYRSPEMSDIVEFAVSLSTSIESIGALKARIKAYLESKPQHWRPAHNVIVKEIENVNTMKMALYVTHTINFQNTGDKNSRRSDLVLELKKIFEDLNIKFRLLPQEVHLSYVGSGSSTDLPIR
ncbi:Mechanosensitive ion channel protein [Quillaja saponaria]|uniref:Mechanosensitive ion channel protein n=1 Tax=Quillaja saponaria TaxID=32244 RepID=A0AAD7VKW3_QUISA|nr:Mechanosensitive ion channel protein [Quillaja saponaria]